MEPLFQAYVDSQGRLQFQSPAIVQNYLLCKFAKKWVRVTFALLRKAKTPEQLGYYRVVILPTIHQHLVAQGHTMTVLGAEIPIDPETAHAIIKHFCARKGPDGRIYSKEEYSDAEIIDVGRMDRQQQSDFLRNSLNWGRYRLNLQIPDPDPNWKSKRAHSKHPTSW